MNRNILSALTFIAAVLSVGATDCRAAAVTVEVRGEVDQNQIPEAPLGDVQPGEEALISFTVNSDDFQDNPNNPTRGYVIDLDSFELSFSGGVSISLTPSFTGPAYFVLRDNDPQVDGFFLSEGLDFNTPLPLDQEAQIADFFGAQFQVTYDDDPLPSLDILDALGSYDFTGLTVFGMRIDDGPAEGVLGMVFESLTIAAEPDEPGVPAPLTPANGVVDVEPQPEFTWEGVANCPGEFVSLGVPGGQATWISPDGTSVVGSYPGEGGGWIWTADTGTVVLPSSASAVGLAGNDFPAAGSAPNPDQGGRIEAAIWSSIDAQPQFLGGLPGGQPLDGTLSTAYGISSDGSTVVGLAYGDGSGGAGNANAFAFIWTEDDGMVALPKLNTASAARANGVSDDGSIVWGWNDTETGFRRAVRWVDGTIEELQNSEGGSIGEASGANSGGTVIVGGGLQTTGQEGHAWRWTADTGAVSIGDLVVSLLGSNFAFGASDDGNLIVGATGFGFDRNATIWTAKSGELRWLTDVLDELAIDVPAAWHLGTALAVSADGKVIAGWGSDGADLNSFLINLEGKAFEYRLQVATDAGFGDIVIDETVAETSLIPAQALAENTQYYWRVQGIGGCGDSNWSEVFSFTTIALDPGLLQVEPEALDLGDVVAGGTETGSVTVSNAAAVGAADLVLTQLDLITGAPEFTVGGDCGATLAPQESCTVEIHFAPAAVQAYAGILRIEAEDNDGIDVPLSGTGVEKPDPVDEIFSDRFQN